MGCLAAGVGIVFVRDATVLTVLLGFAAGMLASPSALWLDARRGNGS